MSTAEQLRCIELVEIVTEYLEGGLAPEQRVRFEAHLAGCDGCTTYVEQIRTTIALCGSMDAASLDPAERTALLEAFHGWAGE
jgi:anti-sigma factor RsiW